MEAQAESRRHHKAYLADHLEGPWRGWAASGEKPFASRANVVQSTYWTDNISHGELLRAEVDEFMEVDPGHLRFLFQGASDADYRFEAGYGGIAWKLGMLEQVSD